MAEKKPAAPPKVSSQKDPIQQSSENRLRHNLLAEADLHPRSSSAGSSQTPRVSPFVPAQPSAPISPGYPRIARQKGIEGTVVVGARIGRDGMVEEVFIEKSSGSALLDEAALASVRKATFRPALRNGNRIEWKVLIPITFRLR